MQVKDGKEMINEGNVIDAESLESRSIQRYIDLPPTVK